MGKKHFFILFIIISITSFAFAQNFYISKNVANLHAEANKTSELCSQAIYGTLIKILKEHNNWYYIETPDKYQGWILKDLVISKESSYPNTPNAKIKSLWAHIYPLDDITSHPPIITLVFETKIEVMSPKEELSNRWIKIRLIDGNIAYAQSRDLDFDQKILSIDEMTDLSKTFLNIPYYWGGSSSFGYDCSGFAQMLYRQMGINILRDSSDQAQDPNLQEVKFENLQKGDLVFFSDNQKKIAHVGIYLGNNEIIHSATKNVLPKVQITKISFHETLDGINIHNFFSARRIKQLK